jgi:hypothetical protein
MGNNVKVNPLNVFNARRVEYPPSHFEYTNIQLGYNMKEALDRWIELHLNGRFYLGKNITLDDSNKLTHVVKIGFEDKKELSYFMLACPHLKYN